MALLTRNQTQIRVTADNFMEFANSPEFDDCLVELVEGEVITIPFPNGDHGEIVIEISSELRNFVKPRRLGRVTGADAGFLLERSEYRGDTVRGLDVAFRRGDKIVGRFPQGLIEAAPDLAVEVMSPSNTVRDINLKIDQLLDAGCSEVWIVDPDRRRVDAHSADGIRVYRDGDAITCPDILPGFELAVSDIFYD